ncbi:unnamed protein product [Ranitomeya imitator]|uniref:Ubiquitin-like domain-containing protein n=1 Tax=Ranitomeya imitator TaxID=111125 RepID=A0ABN9MDS0_9NEOB|nr:unnamed protein product [Ranitomeya imitator]
MSWVMPAISQQATSDNMENLIKTWCKKQQLQQQWLAQQETSCLCSSSDKSCTNNSSRLNCSQGWFMAAPTQKSADDFSICKADYFHIQVSDDKKGRRFLELIYAGGVLRDEWVLTDAGITLCSTIKCIVKEEEKPALYVYNMVTKEKVPVMGNSHLVAENVSKLKSLLSVKCGFPVSVFCLRTLEGKEMYDCNTLSNYNLDLGM